MPSRAGGWLDNGPRSVAKPALLAPPICANDNAYILLECSRIELYVVNVGCELQACGRRLRTNLEPLGPGRPCAGRQAALRGRGEGLSILGYE